MENPVFEDIVKARNGHYCHVVEVSDVSELEEIANIINFEFSSKHGEGNVIDFLQSLEVICTDPTKEGEVYSFSFKEYMEENI